MLLLVIAIYCDSKKPNVDSYLERFVNEMKDFKFLVIKDKKYDVHIRAFIADAPAKALIKQIKQHGAYYACDHCHTKGEYNEKARSISYHTCTMTLRTDDEQHIPAIMLASHLWKHFQ